MYEYVCIYAACVCVNTTVVCLVLLLCFVFGKFRIRLSVNFEFFVVVFFDTFKVILSPHFK
jgi:hypothetical protein